VLDVKSCATCGREIADSASACDLCEAWAAALVEPRPADDAAQTSESSTSKGNPLVAAATTARVAAAATTARAERATGSRRQLSFIAAAVAAVALTGFAMSARGGSPPDASGVAAPTARVTAPPASAPPATAETAVQKWSIENQATWLDNPRRGAAFDLRSENVVKTSFGPARPTLIIRCTAQRIEAFVITGSPMKIDPRVDGKTVTISMDGEPVRTEQWIDSDDHKAVFAPDAAAFTQRLRTARTLHFGYSPHNSSDVVAQFHVPGIDGLIAAAPRHCGATK
jgi:hypothetical protein